MRVDLCSDCSFRDFSDVQCYFSTGTWRTVWFFCCCSGVSCWQALNVSRIQMILAADYSRGFARNTTGRENRANPSLSRHKDAACYRLSNCLADNSKRCKSEKMWSDWNNVIYKFKISLPLNIPRVQRFRLRADWRSDFALRLWQLFPAKDKNQSLDVRSNKMFRFNPAL